MSPRSRFVVLLVLSALAGSYGQTGETGETEGPTTVETDPTTAGPVPSTTSTAPAPAPAVPTSIPNKAPAKGSWNVTTKDRTCIQSMMGLRIGFTYTDKDNKTQDISYDVPAAANETTMEGSGCGANRTADETLAIGFFGDKADAWKLTLTFKYDGSKKNWAATDVSLKFVMNSTFFPNVTGSKEYTVSLVNQSLFQTANSSSYQCVSTATLKDFKGADNPPTVNITTAELQVEAFREFPGDFSTAVPCPADTEVSNIVPIAVGAALAALVVIVLIAYLIGRKKNKRGYESV